MNECLGLNTTDCAYQDNNVDLINRFVIITVLIVTQYNYKGMPLYSKDGAAFFSLCFHLQSKFKKFQYLILS